MWALVINPVAGQGKGTTVGTYVAGWLSQRKIPYTIVTGNTSVAMGDHLSLFIEKFPDTKGVIAVGGDGLLHNILQRILSTGFDSIVNEKANTMSWPKGPMKYNAAIAIELPRFKPRHYQITLDDRTISTEAMLIAVSNGRSYGGGMLVCPNANIVDGLFDVMVLHPVSTIEFIKVFPRVFAGSPVSHPAVEIVRSRSVRIESKAVAYADGERIGQLPISAECIPGALRTWVA